CDETERDGLLRSHDLELARRLRVTVVQPEEDLVAQERRDPAPAFDPLGLERRFWLLLESLPAEPAQLRPVLHHNPGYVLWLHAATQAEQGKPKLNQMLEPVTDPVAGADAQIIAAKGHPQQSQVTHLVGGVLRRRHAVRQRPQHLAVRQIEFGYFGRHCILHRKYRFTFN